MKKFVALVTVFIFSSLLYAQWKPAGDKIMTEWGENLDINHVWEEYPRPLMVRSAYSNLNGLWDYAVTAQTEQPTSFDGKILVPFAIESALSGVGKSIGQEQALWYNRTFSIAPEWKGNNILLHFGAVDWCAEVWVNNQKVGTHTGGYTPFSIDITSAISFEGDNKVTVKVTDSTDRSFQPRGKQVSNPEGIWYTSVTGIWQTVWLEPVPQKAIQTLRTTPDIDKSELAVEVITNDNARRAIEIKLFDGKKCIATVKGFSGEPTVVSIPPKKLKLWSPDSPFLYNMTVSLFDEKKVCDKVDSYAAMRKISTKKDADGIVRLQLNNQDLFQMGPLDQGWWPDGLYTAPCDEAMKYDLEKTKELGFNMVRKHVKVEPARWYTHCDKLGLLVWQDMPSGDAGPQWQNKQYFNGEEKVRSEASEANYRKEWKEIIDLLYSNPCVVVWVPFNEAWGQFKTKEIVDWTKNYDASRLVNPASGGNHYRCGDMLDLHNYPAPDMYLYDNERANVLGEYGGIGLALEGHLWVTDRNWGYVQFKTSQEATDEYIKFANQLYDYISKGFSAAVYTQTTDVECEINGLMTYDRKVIKMDVQRLNEINSKICNYFIKHKK